MFSVNGLVLLKNKKIQFRKKYENTAWCNHSPQNRTVN